MATTTFASDEPGDRLAACAACHGKHGEGVSGAEYYPHLAGKPAGYLLEQLKGFRDGRRINAQMTWLVQFLDDAYLDEIAQEGIDLTPKCIPAEVFDKRAVDKGQVVFHDISFVGATPRYAKGRSARDKLTVQIELSDFSVYYNQGAAEAAIVAIKDGKSDVICDQGQLVKVSKSKDGVIKRDVLTKHWTDWVDYWAVDFDYQSRKEIIRVPIAAGIGGVLPGFEHGQQDMPLDFEERWTGGYIFENEWQTFRTRKSRDLELITAEHTYDRPGRYIVAVKVIDIFGNDTMTLVPVNVG